MVGSMVSCWWDSDSLATTLSLAWEEVGGAWKCESGDGVGKVDM